MTGPPANATVLDTTALSNFGQVDRVELLYELPRIVTVSAVKEELRAGAGTHPYIRRALAALGDEIPVVTPTASAEKREEGFLETLDPGEAQALAVAETVDGVLVSDDGDARSAAEKRGLSVTGSIGLLVRFVEDGQISSQAADGYLKRWIDEAGFRSPDRDFAVFLDERGDSTSNRNMCDSNVRERLDEKHEGDWKERVEGIERWIEYIRNEPPSTWGPQQNAIVEAQLDAAQRVGTSASHQQHVVDVAEAIREEREDVGDGRE